MRFLSRDEYDKLHKVIAKRFPEHLAEFVVSVHTGMRLTEQYTCTWSQVHLDRRTIELTKTKNGSARTVHLNSDAVSAIESLRRSNLRLSDPVFPRQGKSYTTRVRGSIRAWKRQASRDTSGTRTDTHSARGWQWPAHPSKRIRRPQATRRSRWRHAIATCRQHTDCRLLRGLPQVRSIELAFHI